MAASQSFTMYQGDTWRHQIMVGNDGARYVVDGVTDGSDQFSSNTAKFVQADIGELIATRDGTVIPDGTYITAVATNGKSCTMSANATAAIGVKAVVRAADLSNYTPTAEVRSSAGASLIFTFTIDSSRKDVGSLIFSRTAAETKAMGGASSMVYDLQLVDTNSEVSTIMSGTVSVTKEITA